MINRKGSWGLMTVLAGLVAAYAFMLVAMPGLRPPFAEALFSEKSLRTFGHLGAGGVAIVTGAVQFSTRMRFQSPHLHRLLGKVYIAAVLISGGFGGFLAPSSSGGVAGHFGFGLLAVLWVATALIAFTSARSGDYSAHRAWMIRSYALCLAAVTLRLYLPLFGVMGVPFDAAYPAIAWLCWTPNLIIAEWLVIPSSLAPLEPAS